MKTENLANFRETFRVRVILLVEFENNITGEAGYKTLLLAVYKTSLFFGGSERAGYKTSLFFGVPRFGWL